MVRATLRLWFSFILSIEKMVMLSALSAFMPKSQDRAWKKQEMPVPVDHHAGEDTRVFRNLNHICENKNDSPKYNRLERNRAGISNGYDPSSGSAETR